MATESVLIHDGQCAASANYGNGAGLNGNGGSAQFYGVVISAARTVALASSTGAAIYGILQGKPAAGDAADVGVFGPGKMLAGGTIAAGAKLMVNSSGEIVPWTPASGYQQIGVALEAAVNGQTFTGFVFGPGGPLALT